MEAVSIGFKPIKQSLEKIKNREDAAASSAAESDHSISTRKKQ
jgi:hypothetical protein